MKVVIASRNCGKVAEIRRMLKNVGIEIISMDEAGLSTQLNLPEQGQTFEANALSKARTLQRLIGGWVLGEDSGLVVDALGGAPGVYSARYAGAKGERGVCDRANRLKLLDEVKSVEDKFRSARFICFMALVGPKGKTITAQGNCEGRIGYTEKGNKGFGYDSVFLPQGYTCTFAELAITEKNKISHRGKALYKLMKKFSQELQIRKVKLN
jgi:XTP/dITP diphosphohydrolase